MPTVVLGYVPKPEGEAALTASIAEAQLRKADLVVVNSHRSRHGDLDAQQTIEAELDEVRARVEEAGVAVDVRHPETGLEAAEDLLNIAEEVNAELVVIGLRRRTPVGKLILGSSAQRILLDAHCPVLAVKSG
jgi:Universal stress protein family